MGARCLLLILALLGQACLANEIQIFASGWFTFGDDILRNDDSYSSFVLLPVAIQHFNERRVDIIPDLAKLKTCNATLRLVDDVIYDTQGLPNVAMSQFIRKFSHPGFDIAYVTRSETAQPIAVTAGALNTPAISHMATSDALSNKVIYPTFFRTTSSDGLKADWLAKLFKIFKYRAVGLIYIDDAFGTAFRASLQSSLGAQNIRLVAAAFRGTATGTDLEVEVKKALKVLIDERIRVIYHAGLDSPFVYALAKAASEYDWIDDRLYMSNRILTNALLDGAPNREMVFNFLRGSLYVGGANNQSNPSLVALNKELLRINITTDVNPYLPDTTARNGVPIRVPDDYLIQLLPKMSAFRSYTLAYDAMMAIGFAACGSESTLLANLAKVNFYGTTGTVTFDANHDRASEAYGLDNLQADGGDSIKIVRVGYANRGNWSIDFNRIQFDDGTSDIPIDIEPPVHQIDSLTTGAKIWGYIEASLAILFSGGMLVYLVMHQSSQAFVESQPIFMFLLACGCVLMGTSIIGLVIETDAGCMMFPWLFSLGFTLSLSSLIAKSVRVAILWYSRGPIKQRNHSVRATVLLGGVGLAIVGLLCILIAWQVVAPLTFVINTTKRDAYNYPLYSSAMCVTDNPYSTTFLALLITYVCLVVFVTMWVSFWVRNAPEKFQEARMTAVAGVSMFQVFFVGVPTAAAVWNMALPRFLVLSSLTFLLCLIILVTMFLPKIMRDRFGVQRSSEMNEPLVDPNVDTDARAGVTAAGTYPQGISRYTKGTISIDNYNRGVINIRGKKRKKEKVESGNHYKRSIVERVLESVQEVDDDDENDEKGQDDGTGTNDTVKSSGEKTSKPSDESKVGTSNTKATDEGVEEERTIPKTSFDAMDPSDQHVVIT